MNFKLIWHLLYKDILLELRQKYALNGILLYVFSTLFIIHLSFNEISVGSWLSLYWIVVLFAAVNAGAKSFIQEGRPRLLYYYTISSPENIILSKFLYNALLLIILAYLSFLGFIIFFGNVIGSMGYFSFIIFLGATGFSANFSMISAIASKGKGSATLMTILSFPVIIPQLMLLIRLSKLAAAGLGPETGRSDWLALSAINLIVIIVSYLLFPYLWRD